MTQITSIGEADVEAFIKVDRVNGTTEFYRVLNGENIPISKEEYMAETGEEL